MNKELIAKNINYLINKPENKSKKIWKNAGMSESRFSEIKNGKWGKNEPVEYLKSIADVLNISFDVLTNIDIEEYENELKNKHINLIDYLTKELLLVTSPLTDDDGLPEDELDSYREDMKIFLTADNKYNILKLLVSKALDKYDETKNKIQIVIIMSYLIMFYSTVGKSTKYNNKFKNYKGDINDKLNDTIPEMILDLEDRKEASKLFNEANDKTGSLGMYCLRELSDSEKYRDYSELYTALFGYYDFYNECNDSELRHVHYIALMERILEMDIHKNRYLKDFLDYTEIEYETFEVNRELK